MHRVSANPVLYIKHLLKDSVQLQERLSLLQVKGDLLDSVFGHERSDNLQDELSAAIRNRELLHTQLLQRRSRLQVQQRITQKKKMRHCGSPK